MTPRDHRQSDRDFRRRQVISAVVVVIGALVLGYLLRIQDDPSVLPVRPPARRRVAAGAFASGPLHLGRIGHPDEPDLAAPRPVVQPLLHRGGALARVRRRRLRRSRRVPWLDDNLSPFIEDVLEHSQQGQPLMLLVVTVVNGIAEELFFRGAMYAAIRSHQVAVTAVAYTVATLATGNVMLGFAAILLGIVVGLQRRATGGILAPIITHLVWSVTMLYALPAIFLARSGCC